MSRTSTNYVNVTIVNDNPEHMKAAIIDAWLDGYTALFIRTDLNGNLLFLSNMPRVVHMSK